MIGSVDACLDEEVLVDMVEGRLSQERLARLDAHVDHCRQCRALLAAVWATTPESAGLEQPEAAPPAVRGALLARYLLLDMVGAGASGIVYAAYDPELDRKVAIKVLRMREGQDAVLRSRTLREAQAMARLTHANVVSVYDVGSVGDRVFVVMEFVEGRTLAAWLAEATRSWREIVKVFLQAGRGLAAAHTASLVHRDFKPENVLLSSDGRVLVTDFGLARPTGQFEQPASERPIGHEVAQSLTQTGAVVGTPAYMSPEQLRGEAIDARSDLFSFCVALYEALHGQRPFAGSTVEEIQKQIIAGNVQPPPKTSRAPLWIHRILARGLRLQPSDRFPSMEALLAELGRDPVAKRRQAIAAVGVLGLLAAVVAGQRMLQRRQSLACRGAEQKFAGIWDPDRSKEIRRAFLATGQPSAADQFAGVARTLDMFADAWSQSHRSTCEATRLRGEQSEEMLDLRMACLDEKLSQARALTELFTHADASMVVRAPTAASSLEPPSACSAQMLLRARAHLPETPAARARAAAIETKLAGAKASEYAGRFADEGSVAAEAFDAAEREGFRPLASEASYWRGVAESHLGHLDRSEILLLDAATRAQAVTRDDITAQAFAFLAQDIGFQLRFKEAHLLLDLSHAAIDRLGGRDDLEAFRLRRVASVLTTEGRLDESIAAYEQALKLQQRASGGDSVNVATLFVGMARALTIAGRQEEALAAVRRGSDIYRRLFGPNYPRLGDALIMEGHILRGLGRKDEAIATTQRALDARINAYGTDNFAVVEALVHLGDALIWAGRPAEAVPILERAIDTGDRIHTPYNDVPVALGSLGSAWLALGKPARAVDYYVRSLAHPKASELPPGARGPIELGFAKAEWATGKHQRAIELAESAQKNLSKAPAENAEDLADALAWLKGHGVSSPAKSSP
jgi:tetratricopeptide (TPR) repeat protein/tRNA A-37 threonylcarbamoyl transferase component Bud32